MNETALFEQVEAMAKILRPHGFTHILHDYGWQVCGDTYHIQMGCVHVDQYGRLFPDPQRFPSTSVGGNASWGSWKHFIEKTHAQGIAFGLHLMHGIPKIAVQNRLPIMGTNFTAADIVAEPRCQSFIPDHWAIDPTHPGALPYYDSVVSMWAEQGLDFIYFDGIVGDCGHCNIGVTALLADSLRRLGNGMHLFTSWGPPTEQIGCPFDALSELAPYVRVGADTEDGWGGRSGIAGGFSEYTRSVAPSVRAHHFGDLAALMVGKVHCKLGSSAKCKPGPDYYVPSNDSTLTKDEVISYASMVAIFRSSWWPAGALSEMDDFTTSLLTNDAVIRITMMSTGTRQVIDATSKSFDGPGVVWTADDSVEAWKYVLLVNMAQTTGLVAVDFVELGVIPTASCNVTELWGGQRMGQAYGKLQATLRPHASLLVRLDDCKNTPHFPPVPPAATAFCPAGNTTACVAALTYAAPAVGTCSADFEHVERRPIPTAGTIRVDALHADVEGNKHSDLHVVGVIYADAAGGPAGLLATSTPVLVPADAPRSFVRLPFADPVSITRKYAGEALWLGEQAGAPGGVPTQPGGPNSLACLGFAPSTAQPACAYTPQPFASGPKVQFGPSMTCSTSLSIFATVL